MNGIEKAINRAKEVGWWDAEIEISPTSKIFLDPLFWKALGKSEEWVSNCNEHKTAWEHYWHRFIDHISEGKDIGEFFDKILK